MAHILLSNPEARTNEDFLIMDPCGGRPAGSPTATYTAGTDIEITVNVSIVHNQTLSAAISFDYFRSK